mmetsp:Transcript_96519/g.144429  ORF Transcript_96519/g.144429 Transcript_96519/m.144429 type:complete len:201 (-) Transcript_96519:242-844(-)|eukprot:CAMPEP_0117028782 /NCGR_PEP_ID=MMETSP0472-20121206/20900_1 /TAXON_ID=693140 ORGANISM="Tiarina fusus, Strain LIS" /NCGR_SAMPLE_ID=MMETSP0472 /ASSEMBLY_ACC=CAM_ASM_000603 /LENGTH=200 /DNA_ID=CAMNT_0004736371 /DNA_START=46 /DNA_END=648 /DNA_ORIENTATION=+
MKSAILASLVASAAAFAPAQQKSSSTALSADFSKEIGVQAPLGFWDPLGVLEDSTEEQFNFYREIEIKHGRVAMLAFVGYTVTAAGFRFPGCESYPDGLQAFPAIAQTQDGKVALAQMFFFFVVAEAINRDAFGLAEFPGDYRNGALDFGWDKFDDATKIKKRTIELNQGRAAQMGILGLVTHEMLGNSIIPSGYLPGHS